MMQFDKFLLLIFFINVTIRECNFAMGTILGKGFAQDCPHGEIRHSRDCPYGKVLFSDSDINKKWVIKI